MRVEFHRRSGRVITQTGPSFAGLGVIQRVEIEATQLCVSASLFGMVRRRVVAIGSVASIAYRSRSLFRPSAITICLHEDARPLQIARHLRPYEAELLLAAIADLGHARKVVRPSLAGFVMSTPAAP